MVLRLRSLPSFLFFCSILHLFAFARGNSKQLREQSYTQTCHLPPTFQDNVILDRSLVMGEEVVSMEIVDSIEKHFYGDDCADAGNNVYAHQQLNISEMLHQPKG